MNKYFKLILVLICIGCSREIKHPVEIEISPESVTTKDYLKVKFINNDNRGYIFYLESKIIFYTGKDINQYNLEVRDSLNKRASTEFHSAPFFIIDEQGNLSEEDQKLEDDYFDCMGKDYSELLYLPANSTKNLSLKIIDSVYQCGIESYPILKKDSNYKLRYIVNQDSTKIPLKKIQLIKQKYPKDTKIYHGIIYSNNIRIINKD